ncbi:MAG: PaREP1 family protein [Chloroflexi bacterium]|nr:PaREP1 family protein [Chloroflexota bacterium]
MAIGGILLVETPYKNQSRVFLAQAEDELAHGDLYQAAEKGWGAAAQIVKAIADARGWEHDSHRHLFNIVRRLVDETDDDSLSVLFSEANLLHVNFYEGELSSRQAAYHLSHVVEFVNKVEGQLE